MLIGETVALSGYPVGVLPAARNFGVADPFRSIDPNDTDLTYLVEMSPFDPEASGAWSAPPSPVGTIALGSFSYTFRGAAPALYLGDHHNYLSLPGDSPANTPFPGRLAPAYALSARLGSAGDPLGGAAVDIGNIGIVNGDGTYDSLLRRAWGDRPLTVKVGKATWSYNVFARALVGSVAGIRASEGSINLALGTILSRLDRPVQRQYWTGSGGAEGGANLAGQPKPVVWGYQAQVPGILIDAANSIWQFAETLSAISDLRDRGVGGFTGGTDYATYTLLAAAVVGAGAYATCLAEGMVKFGSGTVTLPTADCEGAESIGNTPGAIALSVAQTRLGSGRNLAGSEVDAGAFSRLDTDRPWETGFYLSGEATARSVIDQLMRDAGAAVTATRDGLLSCVAYDLPGNAPAELAAADIDTDGISIAERVPGAKRVTVLYAPRARVLSPAEMTDAVATADRISLGSVSLYATTTRSPMDADAREIAIATGLRYGADAATLAGIAADLLESLTHYYRIPVVNRAFRHWIGDARRLSYDRFGADDGLNGILVGIDESNEGGNSLILWGPRGGA